MMGHGESGRPHAGDEDLVAVIGIRQVLTGAQRIPAGQQVVDLDAPGQREHVRQDASQINY